MILRNTTCGISSSLSPPLLLLLLDSSSRLIFPFETVMSPPKPFALACSSVVLGEGRMCGGSTEVWMAVKCCGLMLLFIHGETLLVRRGGCVGHTKVCILFFLIWFAHHTYEKWFSYASVAALSKDMSGVHG